MLADERLTSLLEEARSLARPPISHFTVGAVGLGASGRTYQGFNLEFPGLDLAHTIHAEQSLVALAMQAGETALVALAVSAPPCGHCRQFLRELGPDLTIQISGRPVLTLESLLPHSFGPTDLGVTTRLLQHPDVELELDSTDAVVLQALQAARRSYAPYSLCAAGVCIESKSGRASGSYVENAAFNPSLSPLQAALVGWLTEGHALSDINRVVLVHRATSVDLEPCTRNLLHSLAPKIRLETVSATDRAKLG